MDDSQVIQGLKPARERVFTIPLAASSTSRNRAPTQDVDGVQRHPHPTLFQVARLPRQAPVSLEHPAPCRAVSAGRGTFAAYSWQKAGPQSQSPTPPFTGCRSQPSPWPRRRSPCRRSATAAPWPAGWAARCPGHCPDALLVGLYRVTDKKPAAPLVGGGRRRRLTAKV